ncbi:SIMPL domain-containing protein [Aquiflexum gelatinilyticum]|uniref:SIMPL domain-containing protein n=1 Tax=Aquiflexum gelatinilyticum TaxID=2961943 RepID=UPI0021691DA9|nr:SIMPL domain-containing protein [Aquiflexum gelatinilyticum]MCS4434356.1 SIMPL domain-containing protein [Aquiflexum gelatinilyticum]
MKKLLFALPFLFLFGPAFAQENIPLIQVEGTSELSIMPDEALMFINLSEKALKVSDATNALNKKTKSIEDALKKTKVSGYTFTVDNYFVNVNRVYSNNSSKDSGYVAAQTIKVRVKIAEQNLVKITEALHQTTDMTYNVQFQVSDALRKSSASKLLELAISDAKSKTEVIAKSLGLSKLQVHNVTYTSGNNNYMPVMRNAKAMLAMDTSESYQEPTFSLEEQKLNDRVMVSFSFSK